MKKIFRIGAAAVAAVLLLCLISCSNEFFVKKEGDVLLEQIKYEGTLGGKGTKDDPYIVNGQYTIKMPEAIDKGDYKICVQERRNGIDGFGATNYNKTEIKEVADPLLADFAFESVCTVGTMENDHGFDSYGASSPTKTFYFKIPHITNEKCGVFNEYEFLEDGKKLKCIRNDLSNDSKLELIFEVTPEDDVVEYWDYDGSIRSIEHFCTFKMNSCKYNNNSVIENLTETLKSARKFSYSSYYSEDYGDDLKFIFDNKYVWDDTKSLKENLTFCRISGTDGNTNIDLMVDGDKFYICFGESGSGDVFDMGEFKSESGGELTGSWDGSTESTFTLSVKDDGFNSRELTFKYDDKQYTLSVLKASISSLAEGILKVFDGMSAAMKETDE